MTIHSVTDYSATGQQPVITGGLQRGMVRPSSVGNNAVRDLAIREALEFIHQNQKETYIVGQFVMRGVPLEAAQEYTRAALAIHQEAKLLVVNEQKAAQTSQGAIQKAFEESLKTNPIPEDQIVSVGSERIQRPIDFSSVMPTEEVESQEIEANKGVIHPMAIPVELAQTQVVHDVLVISNQGQPITRIDTLADFPNTSYPKLAYQTKSFMLAGREMTVSLQLNKPNIVVIENFASDLEVSSILGMYKQMLRRSTVHKHEDGSSEESDYRSSSSASLPRDEMHRQLEERISVAFNWPATRMENFEMVNYTPGQEYKQHCDYFDNESVGGQKAIAQWNGNRVATAILYLEAAQDGGGTGFPLIGLEVNPKPGSLVFFSYPAGWESNKLTTHSGLPVVQGEKTILTKWMRAQSAV